MPEKPIISIITVNLNDVEGLKRTMTSVFEQTWQEFEYIVIDGGSTDGSKEYIESHSDKIDYWESEQDNGIFHAMNKGILKSTGKFLQFLNSGDWLFNDKVLANISKDLFDCNILFGNVIKVKPNGEKCLEKGPQGKDITLDTLFRGTVHHGSSYIERDLFSQFGLYDEELKIVSDWKFFLIVLGLNNSKVKFIDTEVLFFDLAGISNTNINLRETERKKVLTEIIPNPIYADYIELLNSKINFKSKRFKMMSELENYAAAKKINSFVSKVLLKIFTGKNLKDL